MNARFHFATCRAGSESTLKRDVAAHHGGRLTPAFMKPQFITWKEVGGTEVTEDFSLFARVSGQSIGLCKTLPELAEHALKLRQRPLRLHVFPRVTPEDGLSVEAWERIDTLTTDITRALLDAGVTLETRTPYANGDAILNVIVGETEAEPMFLGLHHHQPGCHIQPGGLPRLAVSDDVPSRAWLKLEQALAWRGWDQLNLSGLHALDLGCAPGGATYALLNRGMHVTGVDTGEMDERVFQLAESKNVSFEHFRIPAGKIDLRSMPEKIDLILCDINLAPVQVLPIVERLQKSLRARRLILTLKLNTPALEEEAYDYIEWVRRFAPGPVFATQLAGNRREMCVTSSVE